MARTEMEQSAGMEKLRTLYDMYRNLLLVIVVLPINIRHAVNPLPTINCHRKKDEYDVYDYDDPEDFYYDHEDDFDEYGDAEDYWDEAQ